MDLPFCRLSFSDGRVAAVAAGGLVGRSPCSALRIADPRISEAHALVSVRGRELRLIALRGQFGLGGRTEYEISLEPGQVVTLAPGLDVIVAEVHLPESVLAVRLGEDRPRELSGPIYSVVTAPAVDLVPRYEPDAALVFWTDGERWYRHAPGASAERLRPGEAWEIGGERVRAESVPLAFTEPTSTSGRPEPRLRIVARHTTVHIERKRRLPVVIDGVPGRVLSEVAIIGVPVSWEVVAREIWGQDAARATLRSSWETGRCTGCGPPCGRRGYGRTSYDWMGGGTWRSFCCRGMRWWMRRRV